MPIEMRKFFPLLLLSFVLVALFTFPSPVAASACGDTVTVSTTLTADIGPCTGAGLSMGANSIVLDCARHKIIGNGGVNIGISIVGRTGDTVRNCVVTGFGSYGIYLASSSSNTISGNNASGNSGGCGICFQLGSPTDHNTITGNTANSNTGQGFNVNSASFTSFIGNTANSNTGDGFLFSSSSGNNTISGNRADGNGQYGFFDSATNSYSSNECSNNTLGGSSPTGLCTPGAVGGVSVPVDKLAILAPYIGLASLLVAVTIVTIHVRRQRKREEN